MHTVPYRYFLGNLRVKTVALRAVVFVGQFRNFCVVGLRGPAVERRSLAGVLSLSCTRPAADGWPLMPSATGQPTTPTQPASHPFGVDKWVVSCTSCNSMSAASVRGRAIWWTLTKENQEWCCLQVKLSDPCLSALRVCVRTKWRYINTPPFHSFTRKLT